MSLRNKLPFKQLRRTFARPLAACPRLEPSIPHEVSTPVLGDLKAKQSGTFRRSMLASRERVIDYPKNLTRHSEEQILLRVAKSNMRQLIHNIERCPRSIRKLNAKVERITVPEFRVPLQQLAHFFSRLLAASQNEYARRTTTTASVATP